MDAYNNAHKPSTILHMRENMGSTGAALIQAWHQQTVKVLQSEIDAVAAGLYYPEYKLRDTTRKAARVYASALCNRERLYKSALASLLESLGYQGQVFPILPTGMRL